eukprot:12093186-Prorocentrum_lima.AAC.1
MRAGPAPAALAARRGPAAAPRSPLSAAPQGPGRCSAPPPRRCRGASPPCAGLGPSSVIVLSLIHI